jgi:hypothetical protein
VSDVSDVPRDTSQTDTGVSDTPGRAIDLSTWLTKQQAADELGVSTKAIERFAQAGKLEQRTRRQQHGPNVVVYFPDDVARLAAERRGSPPAPFVVRTPVAPSNGHGREDVSSRVNTSPTALQPLAAEDPLRALAAAIAAALMSQTSSQTSMSQTSQTLMSQTSFVTLREASQITGLSQALLRRYIASGGLKAVRDRGWRIRRRDLEAL